MLDSREDEVLWSNPLPVCMWSARALDSHAAPHRYCGSQGPQLVRPPPPMLDSREDEVLWLNPQPEGSFAVLWDHSMCADNVKGAEVRIYGRLCRKRRLSSNRLILLALDSY